jgi:CRISPR system Cascade subunit CasD
MASFGGIAVGERRPGFNRPARSAVLGLVGACLGLEREDEEGQAALAAGYGLALLCHAPGRLLPDYHTAQVPTAERGRRFRTRAAELGRPSHALNTILSRRDYRTGAWHLGALWARGMARWTLDDLTEAMKRPMFVPYLGRKSCPLGLPLAPAVIEAGDATKALAQRHAEGPEAAWREVFAGNGEPDLTVAIDADVVPADDARLLRIEYRRDAPRSRGRWQFDLREEAILQVPAS